MPFGHRADGVWAIREGDGTHFVACDGKMLATFIADGVLPEPATFFPTRAIIDAGKGKATARKMPKSLPLEARWKPSDAVLAHAARMERESSDTFFIDAAELLPTLRRAKATGLEGVRLAPWGDVLSVSGTAKRHGSTDGVCLEFEDAATVAGWIGVFPSILSIDPARLLAGASKLDAGRVEVVFLPPPEDNPTGSPIVVLRQGAYTFGLCVRRPI
jgi:hypothetical protein